MRSIGTFRFTSLVLTLVANGEGRNNSTRSHHRENDLSRGPCQVHAQCGFTITPDLVKRVDFERMECPKCGEKFRSDAGKALAS